jgi:L-arabinose isomerase
VICREVNVPIVLVALQPMKAMDYPNGNTQMQLANDDFCSVPEFTGGGRPFRQTGAACHPGA